MATATGGACSFARGEHLRTPLSRRIGLRWRRGMVREGSWRRGCLAREGPIHGSLAQVGEGENQYRQETPRCFIPMVIPRFPLATLSCASVTLGPRFRPSARGAEDARSVCTARDLCCSEAGRGTRAGLAHWPRRRSYECLRAAPLLGP